MRSVARCRLSRGFTLVELMVVVVISGVLAALGFAAMRRQNDAAKSVEVFAMIQSIRAAQERWKSEHMMYLDVSRADDLWYPRDPTGSGFKVRGPFHFAPNTSTHADNELWLELRPTVTSHVEYGYLTKAGHSNEALPAPAEASLWPGFTWPAMNDNWYVIEAIGDVDGDGRLSGYLASSVNGEVYSVNDGT